MPFLFAYIQQLHESFRQNDPIFAHFNLFFIIHGLVMLLMFSLMVFYVIYLFRTDRVEQQKKVLWAIVLFTGAPIAMPIFWYFTYGQR